MNRTTRADRRRYATFAVGAAMACVAVLGKPTIVAAQDKERPGMNTARDLTKQQRAIAPIAAATAVGDMPQLNAALNEGLDAGLSVSDAKEILVQLYAYTGFPRSLNALGELMKVVDSRKQRGHPGRARPRTRARTHRRRTCSRWARPTRPKLSGAPVKGPLFDFAPAIDEYLKTHLFGDIFARDNLDWQSRELATVGALAALPGVGIAVALAHPHQHERGPDRVAAAQPGRRAGRERPRRCRAAGA